MAAMVETAPRGINVVVLTHNWDQGDRALRR